MQDGGLPGCAVSAREGGCRVLTVRGKLWGGGGEEAQVVNAAVSVMS